MSVFRPSNINKRLVGTQNVSPGNAGQIGPTKSPYCVKGVCCTLTLGQRYFGSGGCFCAGVFKINESFCGKKERCDGSYTDCKGFFICCGPSTAKWFVAACCAEVTRAWNARADAVTVANSCLGSCGWFVPSCAQLLNPGYSCRTYWDYETSPDPGYWSNNCSAGSNRAWGVNMVTGLCDRYTNGYHAYGVPHNVRAFRCTPT